MNDQGARILPFRRREDSAAAADLESAFETIHALIVDPSVTPEVCKERLDAFYRIMVQGAWSMGPLRSGGPE